MARRLALSLTLAAGALAATAGAAVAAPRTTVSPAANLDAAAPTTVTVRGTGFAAPDVTTGIYAAQVALVGGEVVVDASAQRWIRSTDIAAGAFERTLDVEKTLDTGTGTVVDCTVTQCFVSTWREHWNPAPSDLYTSSPIVFAAPAPGTPAVTVEPKTGLGRDTPTEVTITGTGFDPNKNNGLGFYVAYGPKADDFWSQAATFGAQKWVYPGAPVGPARDVLALDGSFRTTLTISPTYEKNGATYDCRVIECAILTFAAHGSADRSLDTVSPIAFAPVPPSVEVSPTTNLNRDGASTITVRGKDFVTPTYASLTALVDGRIVTDAATARDLKRGATDPANAINPDGTFATTLTINPTFTSGQTTIDCRVTQCAITTWRARTNPTPATVYTTTPIAFAPAPPILIGDPGPPEQPRPPVEEPKPTAPTVTPAGKPQAVAKNRTATIASVVCRWERCTVSAPRSVKLKIGKKSYRVAVLKPTALSNGKRGTLRVKLTKAAVKALAGRKAKVSVKFTVKAGTTSVTRTAKVTLKGKKAVKKTTKKGAAKR